MTTSVLIAGLGPAALETALALRALAPDRLRLTLLGPDDTLVYRPISVADPFALATTRRYPLADIARDLQAERITGELARSCVIAHVRSTVE
jgi:sulfide:quinone oxidoreductase